MAAADAVIAFKEQPPSARRRRSPAVAASIQIAESAKTLPQLDHPALPLRLAPGNRSRPASLRPAAATPLARRPPSLRDSQYATGYPFHMRAARNVTSLSSDMSMIARVECSDVPISRPRKIEPLAGNDGSLAIIQIPIFGSATHVMK
ncbi:unnamed protein product [Euphydryas editha]|uniref:Uncharacterized protein n=1 Tax=Euphydryas editha TaxID=104508 RepID=A0AAU9V9W1_EUPED|nr:unnamed protein product [Euphydryas editha]